MSKRTHDKELARARAKRAAAADTKRRRIRIIAIIVILAMGVTLFAAVATLDNRPGSPAITGDAGGQQDGTDDPDAGTQEPDVSTGTDQAEASYESPQGATDAQPCPVGEGAPDAPEPRLEPYEAEPEVTIDEGVTYLATVETTCGTIQLALDAEAAPATVNNFVTLTRDDYYDGVPFHRVIDGFMIQGGDPTGTGSGCVDEACSEQLPGYTIPDELELAEQLYEANGGYPRGTVAMANTGRPDSGGAQFFIIQATPGYPLPPQYAVFGEVTAGMDIVDRIAQGPVQGDLAIEPVRIIDITIAEA